MVGCWDSGSLDDLERTHSVPLHSRKTSCSGQSPSTLEGKEKKGRAIRRHHHSGHRPHMKLKYRRASGWPHYLAHLRSRRPTLTRTTRLSSFTLRGREKAFMPTSLGWESVEGLNLLGIVEGQA